MPLFWFISSMILLIVMVVMFFLYGSNYLEYGVNSSAGQEFEGDCLW